MFLSCLIKYFFLHFQQQSLIAEAEVPEGATEEEVAAATTVGSTVALNGGPQKAADGDLEVGSGKRSPEYRVD